MKKYKLVIFDLDGTLLDTSKGVLDSIKFTIKKNGWIIPDDTVLRTFIGPPIQHSFKTYYKLSQQEAEDAASVFRECYKEKNLLKAVPYDGIYAVFDLLVTQKIKPAIATYKREDYAKKLLSHLGFDKYTEFMYGSDFDGKLKKVDIIKKVIHESGLENYEDIVMIGDSYHDALGAAQIPIDFIGVTYGFDFKNKEDIKQYQSVACMNSPSELLSYFKNMV